MLCVLGGYSSGSRGCTAARMTAWENPRRASAAMTCRVFPSASLRAYCRSTSARALVERQYARKLAEGKTRQVMAALARRGFSHAVIRAAVQPRDPEE